MESPLRKLGFKSHRQYVAEQIAADPSFAEELEKARAEVHFAIQLARMRERRKLTQLALAEAAGLKQPMLARYERGQIPTVPTLQRLAKALNAEVRVTADTIDFVTPRRRRGAPAAA